MNAKAWIPLALALVLGIIGAKLGKDLISGKGGASASNGKYTRLVVAKQDLEPGHKITDTDLKLVEVQADSIPRNAFLNPGDVVGRVTSLGIVSGQALAEQLLAPQGAGIGLQALIPKGLRAISVEVNEVSGMTGLIIPGSRVDVMACVRDEKTGAQTVRTVCQNLKVVAVGGHLDAHDPKDDAGNPPAKSVTLLVSPKDSQAIDLASNAGRTRLSLRSSFDNALPLTEPMSLAELLGGASDTAASHPTTNPSVAVEVIRPTTNPSNVVQRSAPDTYAQRPMHRIEIIRPTGTTIVEFPAPQEDTVITKTPTEPLPN